MKTLDSRIAMKGELRIQVAERGSTIIPIPRQALYSRQDRAPLKLLKERVGFWAYPDRGIILGDCPILLDRVVFPVAQIAPLVARPKLVCQLPKIEYFT
jgi:hypothetical protein